MLRAMYKDIEEDVRCFSSVSACAVHFAHEARRQYAERGLTGDDLFDAVVCDVARLFASYDSTTSEDQEVVHGGDEDMSYVYETHSCANFKTAVANARKVDEMNRKFRKESKK